MYVVLYKITINQTIVNFVVNQTIVNFVLYIYNVWLDKNMNMNEIVDIDDHL